MFMRVKSKCAHQARPPPYAAKLTCKVGKGLLKRQATEVRRQLGGAAFPAGSWVRISDVPHGVGQLRVEILDTTRI